MTDNYSINPQIHGLFGEHVNVRLDTVSVERPNGSLDVNLPVLVLTVEDVDGTEIVVKLDEGSAGTLSTTITDHLGLLRHPEVVERIEATFAGTAETVTVDRAMLMREAVASTRMDRGETISLGPQTNYAVAPGEWLQEWLEHRQMSRDQAAGIFGCSREEFDKIISGDTLITNELADDLALLTGIPTKSWLRMEELYRADLERITQKQASGYECAFCPAQFDTADEMNDHYNNMHPDQGVEGSTD